MKDKKGKLIRTSWYDDDDDKKNSKGASISSWIFNIYIYEKKSKINIPFTRKKACGVLHKYGHLNITQSHRQYTLNWMYECRFLSYSYFVFHLRAILHF